MAPNSEHRSGKDRRGRSRGGRRDGDRQGFTPLVLVADEDPGSRDRCEAILAKLRFAVAPFDSVDMAVRVMAALQPDVIVARADDLTRLSAARSDGPGASVPVVVMSDQTEDPEALVEAIRRALRERKE